MIVTSKRGFAEWGDIYGDSIVATALRDRPLHQAIVLQIEGLSNQLRGTVDLLPEVIRLKTTATANPIPTLKRRGRPPKNGGADHADG